MTAGVLAGGDGPRHCEDLPSLLERRAGRDEGSAALRGFDNNNGGAQPADDPIPQRKVMGQGRSAWRKLRHDRAGLPQLLRQCGVLSGIDDVGTAAETLVGRVGPVLDALSRSVEHALATVRDSTG